MRQRYDLAQLIRNTTRRPKAVYTFATADPPQALQAELLAILMQVVKRWRELLGANVLPAYERAMQTRDGLVRDDANEVEAALDAGADEISRLVLTLTPAMRNWAIRVERWHREQFRGKVKTASGVDLATLISRAGVDESLDAVSARLAGLITNMAADTTGRIRNEVWQSFITREPRATLAKRLYDKGLLASRQRARLIARDQTTKLAAVLDEERQTEIGIDRYTWRHSRKLRPRPEHVARDGKVFSWNKPPADGHPGYAINCGCKAQAYLDLEEDGEE